MAIDSADPRFDEQDIRRARSELSLPSSFQLVGATRWLDVDTGGDGPVQLSLPLGMYLVLFESDKGHRKYGVVSLQSGIREEL